MKTQFVSIQFQNSFHPTQQVYWTTERSSFARKFILKTGIDRRESYFFWGFFGRIELVKFDKRKPNLICVCKFTMHANH
jgi:hypothetical protein